MFAKRLQLSFFLLLVLSFPAFAQETASSAGQPTARRRPWQFYWENDIGVLTKGTDEYYTNGLRLSIGSMAAWPSTFRDKYCGSRFNPCRRMITETGDPRAFAAYAFTHQFWTPQDKQEPRPQPLDRPWAGYMYGSVNVVVEDDTGEKEQHVAELQVGILGQGAGARMVQTEWHKLIGSRKPLGWQNQLKNEPVINLIYAQNRRYRRGNSTNADLIVTPGAVLGTLMTYPSAAVTARLGRHITGFPAMPIAPAAVGTTRERSSWEFYFHAGAEGRLVLHNALLDGGFFGDGPSVDRRIGVYDLRGGFSVRFLSNWRVTGTIIRRSEEFTPPPGRAKGAHVYNSLVVAYEPQR